MHRVDTYMQLPDGNIVVDTTVGHPLAPGAHERRGAAAAHKEKFKIKFITDRYTISEATIIPFAVETYGAMGGKAAELLRFLARKKYGEGNGVAYGQFIAFHRTRIAVAVQRGNAVAIARWRAQSVAPAGGVAA